MKDKYQIEEINKKLIVLMEDKIKYLNILKNTSDEVLSNKIKDKIDLIDKQTEEALEITILLDNKSKLVSRGEKADYSYILHSFKDTKDKTTSINDDIIENSKSRNHINYGHSHHHNNSHSHHHNNINSHHHNNSHSHHHNNSHSHHYNNGYDSYGYDRYGYNRYGYNRYGYDRYNRYNSNYYNPYYGNDKNNIDNFPEGGFNIGSNSCKHGYGYGHCGICFNNPTYYNNTHHGLCLHGISFTKCTICNNTNTIISDYMDDGDIEIDWENHNNHWDDHIYHDNSINSPYFGDHLKNKLYNEMYWSDQYYENFTLADLYCWNFENTIKKDEPESRALDLTNKENLSKIALIDTKKLIKDIMENDINWKNMRKLKNDVKVELLLVKDRIQGIIKMANNNKTELLDIKKKYLEKKNKLTDDVRNREIIIAKNMNKSITTALNEYINSSDNNIECIFEKKGLLLINEQQSLNDITDEIKELIIKKN